MENQLLAIPNWHDIWMDHFTMDPSSFALRFSENKEWPIREIADQIHCYPRAIAKLGPLHRPGMVYRREALEQSSGWAVAGWRAKTWIRLLQQERENPKNTHDVLRCSNTSGKNDHLPLVADLTGGLGIDTATFAMEGANVHYCEKNSGILAVARHNHALLGCSNNIQYHNDDSFRWLGSWKSRKNPDSNNGNKPFHLVYIDPSRRKNGRRVISIEKSDPVISDHTELIRSVANRYLVKLSPVLDLAEIERKLPDCKRIIAVSVDGEVKELLADCIPGILPLHEFLHQKPELHAVIIDQTGELSFHFSSIEDFGGSDIGNSIFKKVCKQENQEQSKSKKHTFFLFEPDPAIIKTGLVDEICRQFGLMRMNRNTSYLRGDFLYTSFPGKSYRIVHEFPYKPRQIKKWLDHNECTRVQIHKRGFPLSVDQLYKKLDCVMGSDAHLIATVNAKDDLVIFIAETL